MWHRPASNPDLKQRHQRKRGTNVHNAGIKGKLESQFQDFNCTTGWRISQEMKVWSVSERRVSLGNTGLWVHLLSTHSHLGQGMLQGFTGEPEMNSPAVKDAVVWDLTPALRSYRERGQGSGFQWRSQTSTGWDWPAAPPLRQGMRVSPWRERTPGCTVGPKKGTLNAPQKKATGFQQGWKPASGGTIQVSIFPFAWPPGGRGGPTLFTLQGPEPITSLELWLVL